MSPPRTARAQLVGEGVPGAPVWQGSRGSPFRVGMSGWTYPPWRGTFYPRGLRQDRELAFASRLVNSIEVNGTFYSLQRPETYKSWYEQTPENFIFSLKGPRFITHIRRLNEPKAPLANFFASGLLWLREKLGPILWQLPPSFTFDPVRLRTFFCSLPRTTTEARALAKGHDAHARYFGWPTRAPERPLLHALEVRHPSFETGDFVDLLIAHGIALVVADTAGRWPALENVTSDFVYARLHGDSELYVSGYTDSALDSWASKARAWSRGKAAPGDKPLGNISAPPKRSRKVFVYFDNDVKVRSPFDAMNLANRLEIGPAAPPFPSGARVEIRRPRWPSYPGRPVNVRSRGASVIGRINTHPR
jgi:uncharacterized protein YecE (DUF72 family)